MSDPLRPYGHHQAPLSIGFSEQEYWSGWPFLLPGDLPDLGIKLEFLMSPALAEGFLTTRATWEAQTKYIPINSFFLNSKKKNT